MTAKTMAFGEGFMKLDVKAKKSQIKDEKKVDAFFRGVWNKWKKEKRHQPLTHH